MSSEWREIRLEAVANQVTVGHVGPMASEYVPSGIPFLRSQNVERLRIDRSDLKYISQEFHERLSKSSLTPGDVVIVRTGKPGACAVIPESLPVANCSDLVIVRCGPELDPRFLAYYVNSVASRHVDSHLVGAVQQHFNVGSARQILLRLPSVPEQQDIAGILSALDDKMELNREMGRTIEAVAQTLFRSWFVDFDPVVAKAAGRQPFGLASDVAALFPDRFVDSELGPIPEGWDVATLGMIGRNVRDGVRAEGLSDPVPYIGLEHMPRKQISLDHWGTAEQVSSGKFRFQQGHILFGKLRPYFHKVGVAPVGGVCSTDILVIEPIDPWSKGLLLGHLSSEEFVDYADGGSTGTRMPRTNWQYMARYPYAQPPRPLAAAFNRLIEPLLDRMNASVFESRTLSELRDALLPRLLSGEISVRNAEQLVEMVV